MGLTERSFLERMELMGLTTKPMTNYDQLIRKTPEELAAWIADQPVISKYDRNNPQHKMWLDWLKQEANE